MEKKRERSRNYTDADKEALLDLIKDYISIIENKKNDANSNKLKTDTWELIAQRYNCVSQTGPRNGYQLKLLYWGIKKKVKNYNTGGKVS